MTEFIKNQDAYNFFNARDYKMEIMGDDGDVFRHLSFRHDRKIKDSFEITTWPYHLCISGDMGTFVFSETRDMFDLFGGGKPIPDYRAGQIVSKDNRFHSEGRNFYFLFACYAINFAVNTYEVYYRSM